MTKTHAKLPRRQRDDNLWWKKKQLCSSTGGAFGDDCIYCEYYVCDTHNENNCLYYWLLLFLFPTIHDNCRLHSLLLVYFGYILQTIQTQIRLLLRQPSDQGS